MLEMMDLVAELRAVLEPEVTASCSQSVIWMLRAEAACLL